MKRITKYLLHREHFIVILLGFILLGLLRLITFNIGFLDPVANAFENFSISDIFFEIQHNESSAKTNDMITLVDMTDLTDRADIANLLYEIDSCKPCVVGVDLIFEGEKDDYQANETLINAAMALGDEAIYSSKLIDYSSQYNAFSGNVRSFFSDEIVIAEAYSNLNDNMEGRCIRDFSIKQQLLGDTLLSFPAQIASRLNCSFLQVEPNDLLINFKNESFPIVKYDEIFEKEDLIKGHVVLVGAISEEQDMHNTPVGKMSGMEIQAYSLLTLLEHRIIKKIPAWIEWILVLLICYLLEITIDIAWQFVKKKSKSLFFVFLKESNVIAIILLFLWMVFVCWVMYVIFVKEGIVFNGGFILAIMTLVCEGRDILIAMVKGFWAKNKNNKLLNNSILKEDD